MRITPTPTPKSPKSPDSINPMPLRQVTKKLTEKQTSEFIPLMDTTNNQSNQKPVIKLNEDSPTRSKKGAVLSISESCV